MGMAWAAGGKCRSNSKPLFSNTQLCSLCIKEQQRITDEGDWSYSSEWWDTNSGCRTVFRSVSEHGNGVVSVVAHPSSRPSKVHWPETEKWLRQRYLALHPDGKHSQHFKVLGYEWRTLHFNQCTRQSTVKVLCACPKSEPGTMCLMQKADFLAVPYLKSMVSVGLTTLVSCNYNLMGAVYGKTIMRILCIGHGGGSLPLFLANKIQGAVIDVVEIDPLVISASIHAMGFPAFSAAGSPVNRSLLGPSATDEMLWKGIHERIYLYECDCEEFIRDANSTYDVTFIDAYDGDDVFPPKLRDRNSSFLRALSDRLHPLHGTVVVNLHSLDGESSPELSNSNPDREPLVVGGAAAVLEACRAYRDALTEKGSHSAVQRRTGLGLGFVVSVPWASNSSLVVCRGFELRSDSGSPFSSGAVVNTLVSNCHEIELLLRLPFPCVVYINRAFSLID